MNEWVYGAPSGRSWAARWTPNSPFSMNRRHRTNTSVIRSCLKYIKGNTCSENAQKECNFLWGEICSWTVIKINWNKKFSTNKQNPFLVCLKLNFNWRSCIFIYEIWQLPSHILSTLASKNLPSKNPLNLAFCYFTWKLLHKLNCRAKINDWVSL